MRKKGKNIETAFGEVKVEKEKYQPLRDKPFRHYHPDTYQKFIFDALQQSDERICSLITREYHRLRNTIQLVAAENICSPAVLAALGSVVQNKTAEGFVGDRLHSGCEVIDEIESLAIERAKEVFGAEYANVQPHSGTSANLIVLAAVLNEGDTILSLPVEQGGHFSHGKHNFFTSRLFRIENYYLDPERFILDYDSIRQRALEVRPKLIICGASVYSRTIDFKRYREIADEVGAYLLADISHISALVAAGVHPSPVDCAHFTTTSTYKAGGPRGGLILMGKDKDRIIEVVGKKASLWELINEATFPGLQGTAYFNNIAAKAVFFREMLSDEYRQRQFKVIANAKTLAKSLIDLGYEVLTGGTDNHMVVVDVAKSIRQMSGEIARSCLERCGVIVDKVFLPYQKEADVDGDGLRLGTPIVTRMGMGTAEMNYLAELIDKVLKSVKIKFFDEPTIEQSSKGEVQRSIRDLCNSFTIF
jgi:glycine hydroxymethyltransferase